MTQTSNEQESIADRNRLEDELARIREDREARQREDIATVSSDEMSDE